MRIETGRVLTIVSLFFLLETLGFAQTSFEGKWATERKQNPEPLSDTQKRRDDVRLELTVDGVSVKGTLSTGGLGGNFFVFDQGKVTGNKVRFQTTAKSGTQTASRTWTVELVDDNTVVLWSYGLDLISGNVLELIQVLPGFQAAAVAQLQTNPPAVPPVAQPVAAQTSNPSATAADPTARCKTEGIAWCYLLHRSK